MLASSFTKSLGSPMGSPPGPPIMWACAGRPSSICHISSGLFSTKCFTSLSTSIGLSSRYWRILSRRETVFGLPAGFPLWPGFHACGRRGSGTRLRSCGAAVSWTMLPTVGCWSLM